MPAILVKGKSVLVDEQDIAALAGIRWCLNYAKGKGRAEAKNPYVMSVDGVPIQRVIMNPPRGMVVDHVNGDPLDNRRCNLRICTPAQNLQNRRVYRKRNGKYKGVNFGHDGEIRCQISFRGNVVYLGTYKTEEECARAYDVAARFFFREFACLNFPDLQIPASAIIQKHQKKLHMGYAVRDWRVVKLLREAA